MESADISDLKSGGHLAHKSSNLFPPTNFMDESIDTQIATQEAIREQVLKDAREETVPEYRSDMYDRVGRLDELIADLKFQKVLEAKASAALDQ